MNFQANMVKACWIGENIFVGYARNQRELDLMLERYPHSVAVFEVAIQADDTHNMIAARCKLDHAKRAGNANAVWNAECDLLQAELQAQPPVVATQVPFVSI